MTNEYRKLQLENAEREFRAAQSMHRSATTKKDRRVASEDIEFWGNKVAAFLSNGPEEDETGAGCSEDYQIDAAQAGQDW